MNIGIVYFSHQGHTQKVVQALSSRLEAMGLNASSEKLKPVEAYNLSMVRVALQEMPNISQYDVLVLGTPVHGGRISAPMQTFLDNVVSLKGMKTALLVTHFFKPAWGAQQTLQALGDECQTKGAQVLGEANVKWFSLRRDQAIEQAVDLLSGWLMAQ
jgi:menaquinone-dependent protoporphyrinogen IX oxidase